MAFAPETQLPNGGHVTDGQEESKIPQLVVPSERLRQRMKKQEVHADSLFVRTRMKKWKERYCVLYSDRTLSYWNSHHDLEYSLPPKGTIDLSTTRHIEIQTKVSKHRSRRRTMSLSNDGSIGSVSKQYSLDFSTIFRDKSKAQHNDSNLRLSHRQSHDEFEDDDDRKEEEKTEGSGNATTTSNNQFRFKIVQSKKGYSFYTEYEQQCMHWITKLKFVIFGRIVHRGYLFHLAQQKRRGAHQWKRRFFVVYDRKEMRYFDNDSHSVPLGMMVLDKLKTLRKSEDRKAKETYGQYLYLIKFEFEKRTVIVSSLEESERDEWYDIIHDVIFNVDRSSSRRNSITNSKQNNHNNHNHLDRVLNGSTADSEDPIVSISNKEFLSPRNDQKGSKYDGLKIELLPPADSPSNTPRAVPTPPHAAVGNGVRLPIVKSEHHGTPRRISRNHSSSGHRHDRRSNRSSNRTPNRSPNRSPHRSPRHSMNRSPNRSPRRSPNRSPRHSANSSRSRGRRTPRRSLHGTSPKPPPIRRSNSRRRANTDRKHNKPTLRIPESPSLRSSKSYDVERQSPSAKVDKSSISSLRKEIADLREEITYLKIQCVMSGVNRNGLVDSVDDVDDELLDCDQYLILDRDWRHWTYLEVVDWIINIEHGRYNKYKFVLFANMKFREFRGRDFSVMEKTDLTNFFGITHFGDVNAIWKHIRTLIRN